MIRIRPLGIWTALATAAVVVALPAMAQAANTPATEAPRSDADCAQLLERWATDAKAAPKRVIDQCKNQLAAKPAADDHRTPLAAPVAALDPCSGPNAASSVLCWGPWSGIAPAAGAPVLGPKIASVRDPETRSELAEQYVPVIDPQTPELPLGPCTPGTPCGFATIVSGVTSNGDPEDTEFGRFSLAPDGTQFGVDPANGGDDIDSVTMTTNVMPRPDGYGNMRASGRDGDLQSRLIARVVQDEEGQVQLAADVWTHGTSAANAQSGYFAWGNTISQAGLDGLNAGNVSVNYEGPMSVNNLATGSMTVDFGANPTWTGNWSQPANGDSTGWSFGAGGVVTGPNLISVPDQFTSNVVGTGNFVQGAIVGEPGGAHGIVHVIDVTLKDQGHIKDVGLLREIGGGLEPR